jgi:hypothetical protein
MSSLFIPVLTVTGVDAAPVMASSAALDMLLPPALRWDEIFRISPLKLTRLRFGDSG